MVILQALHSERRVLLRLTGGEASIVG